MELTAASAAHDGPFYFSLFSFIQIYFCIIWGTMATLGVNADSTVVIIDSKLEFAPRLWFMFQFYGQIGEVKFLNGGFEKWAAEEHEITETVGEPTSVEEDERYVRNEAMIQSTKTFVENYVH